jgi:hypothetical protein
MHDILHRDGQIEVAGQHVLCPQARRAGETQACAPVYGIHRTPRARCTGRRARWPPCSGTGGGLASLGWCSAQRAPARPASIRPRIFDPAEPQGANRPTATSRGSRSIWWYKAPIHGTSLSPKPKPILSVVQPQGKSLHQGQFFVGGGPAASGLGWHPKRVRLVRRAAAVVRTGANGSRSRDMSALRALGPKPAFFSYLASVNLLAFRPFSRSCPQF